MKKYQSYKPSGLDWSGNIPDNWVSSKLKFVLERIVSGGTPDTSNDSFWSNDEDGYSWISISDMTSNPNGIEGTKKKITQSGLENKRLELLPINTLIYSIYGSIGKVNRLKIESTIHQGILGLFPNSKIESRYLEYYLKYIQDFVNILSSSNTQENLNLDKVKNIGIILPPLSEQNQIVQFLEEKTELIDKLISTKERKINLLKEQRTSLINQVVTKGLNPNVKMKDSGVEWIDEIPEHWISLGFTKIIKIRHGYQFREYDFTDDGIKIIKITQLDKEGYLNLDNCSFIDKNRLDEFERILIKENDVLMCLTGGTIGKIIKVGKVDEPLVQNYRVGHFSPLNNNIINDYVFWFMSSSLTTSQMFSEIRETGQPNIGMEDFGKMRLILPPVSEQIEIVRHLEFKTKEIDDLVQLEQKKFDLLKEYRQSLISDVVTGKIKVIN